jgi:phosphoribosylanthranilate isomerase
MAFVKICGLSSYEEARLALDCGATALGFLAGLKYTVADQVSRQAAADIVKKLPATETVLVTHITDPHEAATLARSIGVSAIQVHDDMTPSGVAELGRLVPALRLIKAVHVTGPEAVDVATTYAQVAHALLLDSRTADRLGGTGRTHDWSISRRIVEAVAPLPVYLAGGLNADNVPDAIAAVGPAGVDVNSGVEYPDGRKDPEKLRLFVTRALAALRS